MKAFTYSSSSETEAFAFNLLDKTLSNSSCSYKNNESQAVNKTERKGKAEQRTGTEISPLLTFRGRRSIANCLSKS